MEFKKQIQVLYSRIHHCTKFNDKDTWNNSIFGFEETLLFVGFSNGIENNSPIFKEKFWDVLRDPIQCVKINASKKIIYPVVGLKKL